MGVLMVFNDLSDIRKLEMQVRRNDRLASLGTLSAGMAHEIKNPLVTIKTFTQLLPERYEDPDFRATFSSLVGQEVSRIDTIVNQLLHFARPATPVFLPMHLHEVMEDSLRLVHQQFRQKNILVERVYEARNDEIEADAELLKQVFVNILLNAVDSMDSRGQLRVATEAVPYTPPSENHRRNGTNGLRIRVSIRDSGHGIPPENLPHVFDPFFTTKSNGTGLGLAVAHGIVSEHGGMIDAESEVGRGSIFHVFLPLRKEDGN